VTQERSTHDPDEQQGDRQANEAPENDALLRKTHMSVWDGLTGIGVDRSTVLAAIR
jgi:hypothetical protein